ncbi:hypothetical protein ABVT39_026736 [Epinephelus coioides]
MTGLRRSDGTLLVSVSVSARLGEKRNSEARRIKRCRKAIKANRNQGCGKGMRGMVVQPPWAPSFRCQDCYFFIAVVIDGEINVTLQQRAAIISALRLTATMWRESKAEG